MGTNTHETRLEDFDWRVGNPNVFQAYGIATIADPLALSDDDPMALQNFSRKPPREGNSFKAE